MKGGGVEGGRSGSYNPYHYVQLTTNSRRTCPRTKLTGDECGVIHAARPLDPCTVSRAGIITFKIATIGVAFLSNRC